MENHNRPTEAVSRDIAAFVLIMLAALAVLSFVWAGLRISEIKAAASMKRHRQELALSDELSPFPITRARTVRVLCNTPRLYNLGSSNEEADQIPIGYKAVPSH